MDEKAYSKDELNRAREEGNLFGSILQSLNYFKDEVKEMRKEMSAIKDRIENVITRQELDTKLDAYVTKESIKPLTETFRAGVKWLVGVFIALVVGIVALLALIFGKDLPIT